MFPSPFETAMWLIQVCVALAFIVGLIVVFILISYTIVALLSEFGAWIWRRR